MLILWLLCFAVGFIVGLLNAVLIVRFVTHLQPDMRFIRLKVVWTALLRTGLAALVLGITVPVGWQAGLSTFMGLWLSRWLVVLWVQRG